MTAPEAGARAARRAGGRRRMPIVAAIAGLALVAGAATTVAVVAGGEDDARPAAAPTATASSSTASPSGSSAIASETAGVTPTPTAPSSAPTEGSASASPSSRPSRSSTASAVPDDPRAVARAFFDAALAGDCATAEELVSRNYLNSQGRCNLAGIPPEYADQITIEVDKADVSADGGNATVPISFSFAGSQQSGTLTLVRAQGRWQVDSFEP